MNTNASIATKQIKEIICEGWDVPAYGPEGKHTRKEWRTECLENFPNNRMKFETWRAKFQSNVKSNWGKKYIDMPKVSFSTIIHYDDGTKLDVLNLDSDKQLPWALDFVGHTFDSDLDCKDYLISLPALFNGAIFNNVAIFSGSNFQEHVEFQDAIFNGCCEFNDATFADMDFYGASFCGDAYFRRAKFLGQCFFGDSYDKSEGIWVKKTSFACKADFENAEFGNVGHFERVKFLTDTPAFRGCKIGDTRLEFSDDNYFPKNENSEDAIKNISFLKRLSEEHGQTDQALNFNAMELKAKRKQVEPQAAHWSFKAVTWLYEKLSDYGRSFTEPLKKYLILLLLTLWLALTNAIIFSAKKCENETWYLFTNLNREQIECLPTKSKEGEKPFKLTAWRAASEYTLYRAAGVLDFADSDKQTKEVAQRLFDQEIEPWWMRIWGCF